MMPSELSESATEYKKRRSIACWMAFVGGLIELMIGIRHFPMAYRMASHPEFAMLSDNAADLMILLWLCVGILLVNLGLLSFYFAFKLKVADKSARLFFLAQGITVLIRIGIEIKYPTIVVANPNYSAWIGIPLLMFLFLVPSAMTAKQRHI